MILILTFRLDLILKVLSNEELKETAISLLNKENKAGFTTLDLIALIKHDDHKELFTNLWPYIR